MVNSYEHLREKVTGTMFSTESEMQRAFRDHLICALDSTDAILVEELSGLFGIPDILIADSKESETPHILALELKLSSWRRAIKQAFRYRSFAWESYVVIDYSKSSGALRNIDEFRRLNIGLATFSSSGSFRIHSRPRIRVPYSKGLFEKACARLYQGSAASSLRKSKPNRQQGLGKVFVELGGIGSAVPALTSA